jgi:DNA primase
MLDSRSYILEKLQGSDFNDRGRLHTRCPFHEGDNHPSFSITDKGLFICGSPKCGVRGNFFQFYKFMEGLSSWAEVHDRLKQNKPKVSTTIEALLGVQPRSRKRELTLNAFPVAPFVQPLGEVSYLQERGLSNDLMAYFGVSYGNGGVYDGVNLKHTLVFPIYDCNGDYYTFQARVLRGSSPTRWEHPRGSCSSYLLYAGWLVDGRSRDLWVVEGASDVWRLASYGVQAVGLFTKEASTRQLNLIVSLCRAFKLRPIVCMDGDVPDAGDAIYRDLYVSGLSPQLVYLRVDEDPGGLGQLRFMEVCNEMRGNNGRENGTAYDE